MYPPSYGVLDDQEPTQGTPGVPPLLPPGGLPKDYNAFGKILRTVLPAIATAYALKKGSGLDAFTGGMLHADQIRANEEDRQRQRAIQEEMLKRSIASQMREEARQQRIEAVQMENAAVERQKMLAVQQAAQDKIIHDSIQRALDKATENPAFMDKVNANGPENFALSIPGLGNINLKEAFDKVGAVADAEGKYSYGKAPDDPLVNFREVNESGDTTEKLIPRSQAAAAGEHVVARKAPKEPKEPPADQIKDVYDPATNTYKMVAVNPRTHQVTPIDLPNGATAKPGVGAAQALQRGEGRQRARDTIDKLDADITEAERLGALGPLAGRTVGDLLVGKVGSTGDDRLDAAVARLKTRVNAAALSVDAGVGGVRGAASPMLAKRWDGVLQLKMSPAALRAASSVMRDLVSESEKGGGGEGAKKRIRYDMSGNPIKE